MMEAEVRERDLKVIHCWLSRWKQRPPASGGRERMAIEAKRDQAWILPENPQRAQSCQPLRWDFSLSELSDSVSVLYSVTKGVMTCYSSHEKLMQVT